MKTWLALAALALAVLAPNGIAYATYRCVVETFIIDGRMITCHRCCISVPAGCVTNCF